MINAVTSLIKSVQRGVYSGAGGTVTISSVDVTKSIVLSVSKSSSGYVAARGSITGTLTPSSGYTVRDMGTANPASLVTSQGFPDYSGTRTLSGGTTDLITKQYSAVLTNATTITCDGPVEWQVIEYS